MRFLLFILPIWLFAFYPDFRPCYKKYSYITSSIPFSKDFSLFFGKSKKCVKYDEFTNICILKNSSSKFIKFYSNLDRLGWWIASIRKNRIFVGNLAIRNFDLLPAKSSSFVSSNSVIADPFCRAIGVGSKKGFFTIDYVYHFSKYGYWGDIGIGINEDFKIEYLDPFWVEGFKVGDKIKTINNKPITADRWKKYVVFGKENEIVTINGKKIKLRKRVYNFTPLNYFGVFVQKDLTLKFSDTLKKRYFIDDGAKLISINKKKVFSFDEVREILSATKDVTITIDYEGIILNINLR